MSKRSYHHGDLETAIVEAALRYIEDKDTKSLTLRTISKACGVSATAIYRHFSHKEALFASIATIGFKKISEVMLKAISKEKEPERRLIKQGTAYVEFALDNPGYFEIMFGTYIKNHRDYPKLYEASHASYNMLAERLMEIEKSHELSEEINYLIEKNWALVHGLAILMSKNYINYNKKNRRAIIEAILNAKSR